MVPDPLLAVPGFAVDGEGVSVFDPLVPDWPPVVPESDDADDDGVLSPPLEVPEPPVVLESAAADDDGVLVDPPVVPDPSVVPEFAAADEDGVFVPADVPEPAVDGEGVFVLDPLDVPVPVVVPESDVAELGVLALPPPLFILGDGTAPLPFPLPSALFGVSVPALLDDGAGDSITFGFTLQPPS